MDSKDYIKRRIILLIVITLISIPVFFLGIQYLGKAAPTKANLVVNTRKITSPLFYNWQALAQGGEEQGVRMLGNVVPQLRDLSPRYIRLDHIYDYYNVVNRDASGRVAVNFNELDATVCDIYAAGAKPFFALGYMPLVLSSDGTLVGRPNNWDEWSQVVQKTIEHYSGSSTVLCNGTVQGDQLADIYYEVWNEPDLESFGKWSLYGGDKDYKTLYSYSALGAARAKNTRLFSLGGPGITAAYRNWFQVFLRWANENKVRVDFLSWHHYTKNPDDFTDDVENINSWIPQEAYGRFSALPKIITEWGYDSEPNAIADTNVGAAYTIASARNLIDQKLKLAFSFEVKDGPSPRWGILTHTGEKKPRYEALKFMNLLKGYRLQIDGEGSFVRAIGSTSPEKIVVIVVNYDKDGRNNELVPVTFSNLSQGTYDMTVTYLGGVQAQNNNLRVTGTTLSKNILLSPNQVAAIELIKK
ncbi:hypothetical protein A3G67_00415 [Candidatus Roizmanbacteria bacterium RIFCSPLOWO2_12_FULL_40_12]|nr:MAG: hypothetical protein A2W49_04440 [Candidatus Roizmanbacteria bacterium RIFCSPHIGHO2_12_41_18]OGK58928.1 MAG: hypothetical protein A3H84_04360 [Candidatus Roizmanbacteria bacterium RIFCSPLOWO2_02_FULL_40_13]OGK61238.1 MAG: hypothetical protein A3G67_00415 [Candidatus Roizmanbacteria bacterium RIFCSPLOWO2_12_FULL_40_12]